MTERERAVAAYCLDKISAALIDGATNDQRHEGQAAVSLLIPILNTAHGAATHARQGRKPKMTAPMEGRP